MNDVIALAEKYKVRPRIEKVGFTGVNEAFDRLEKGRLEGRAILVSNS